MTKNQVPLFDYAPPKRTQGAMTEQIQATMTARIEAGIIDPHLWGAEIAVAIDAALEIDNPQPGTKAYARAATRSGLLEALDRLPRPETSTAPTGDLDRVLAAITNLGPTAS